MTLATAQRLARRVPVGKVGDAAEHEANHVAKWVTQSPVTDVAPCQACAASAPCPACSAGHAGIGGAVLRRHAASAATHGFAPASAVALTQSPGHPLPRRQRDYFERRLNTDLGAVRVHTDTAGAQAAAELNADAFALGSHITFASNRWQPDTPSGQRLLAHELAHTLQDDEGTIIRRQPPEGGASNAPAPTPAPGPTPVPATAPEPRQSQIIGETVTFSGVELTENPSQLTEQMTALIAYGLGLGGGQGSYAPYVVPIESGLRAPSQFLSQVALDADAPDAGVCDPADENYERCHRGEILRTKIIPVLSGVVQAVTQKAEADIAIFEEQAIQNANNTLNANEQQAKAEGIRYGLTEKQIDSYAVIPSDFGAIAVPTTETEYGMDSKSPTGKDLQDAAKLLLKRRQDIEQKQGVQNSHLNWQTMGGDDPPARVLVPDDQWASIGAEIESMVKEYNNARTLLSAQYPVLASVSEYGKSTSDLETFASKGPGADMAAIIGNKIADTIRNIRTVRDGLKNGDVNIWRTEKIIELTRVQLGTDADPMKKTVINQKIQSEQPGLLADLLLLVFNIAALLLAGATGGLSLVVAAGVNTAVAVGHVQDYLLQTAMVGSAFDKAKALSQEEPSLFWLAFEIVGTVVDVGSAATAALKTFKTLGPLVKTAIAAREGKEALEAAEAARIVAREAKGEELASKVLAQIEAARGGKSVVIEGLEEESKLLQQVGKASEAEAATGIGKGVTTATGEVHLSRAGHIFVCHSPCTMLEEKYAAYIAKKPELEEAFKTLKANAAKAQQVREAAEVSKDAKALAEAEAVATKVETDAAALEKQIQDTFPELLAAPEDEAALAVKQAQQETAIPASRRLPSDPVELAKHQPFLDQPPAGLRPDQQKMWAEYVDYFNERLGGLKSGAKGVEAPLPWGEYESFLGKFRRGTQYQEGVFKTLQEEAQSGNRSIIKGMQDPYVESNVGLAGSKGETTKFADQLVVDRATLNSGHPHIEAFSNKSRVFDEWFKEK
jgi:hypothetical protein